MTCCDQTKHQTVYFAVTKTGYAVACKKCGRARPATAAEASAAKGGAA